MSAALTLLGEKTTLLSPEAVIASGIPCCRLIQNPGEFVVTFPRAYHVGFSHGFNCGEAANFGTPQWLSVAKEAAVRRAAMNYLPMLSHQQLLYLLTMSFVSRVPRSLLPGVRSSRLRDRQKEERELLVKREFVEDILRENNMLSILLEKESSCRAVLWNPDMLPYSSKGSQMPNTKSAVATPPRENVSCNHTESVDHNDKNMQSTLINEMTLDLETMDYMYLENDDLSCDFQVDSGTLACVACGILGFPFMSVVQPSEKASRVLSVDHLSVHGVLGPEDTIHSPDFGDAHHADSTSVPDVDGLSKDVLVASIPKFDKGWNTCNKLVRPRSFCLQHAVDIIELLQNKGGANILVICHSDYHKIKANAVAIAEEIGNHFVYNEAQLDIASEDDLRLIDLAVEERDECAEDWTSILGINLRHCVKVRKNSPTKQVQHALELGGLFLNRIYGLSSSTINWLSKKSRSKKINHRLLCKPFKSMPLKGDELLGKNSECEIDKREEKFVQYYRRNKKSGNSARGASVVQPASSGDSSNLCNIRSSSCNSSDFDIHHLVRTTEMQHAVLRETGITVSETAPPADCTSTLVGRNNEAQIENFMDIHIDGESCNISGDLFDMQQKIMTAPDASQQTKRAGLSSSSGPLLNAIDESSEMHHEQEIMGNYDKTNEGCYIVSVGQSHALAGGDACRTEVNLAEASIHSSIHVESLKMEDNADVGKSRCEVCDGMIRDNDVEQDFKTANRIKDEGQDSCSVLPIKQQQQQQHLVIEVGHLEDKMERGVMSTCRSNESEPILTNIRTLNPDIPDTDRTSEISSAVILNEVNNIQTIDADIETRAVSSVVQLKVRPSHSLVARKHLENLGSQEDEDIHANTLVSSTRVQKDTQTTLDGPVLNSGVLWDGQPNVEAMGGTYQKENLTGGSTPDHEVECANLSRNKHNDNPSLYPIQKSFGTQIQTCDASEICLSEYSKQGESMEDFKSNHSSDVEKQRKRKRYEERIIENRLDSGDFIRSPCEGLRPRVGRNLTTRSGIDIDLTVKEKPDRKRVKNPSDTVTLKHKKEIRKGSHKCDLEGCRMSFETKAELALHKRNQCPHEGCGKRFSSHKYVMLHQRVHDDDRPLKCPWEGCSMSFKWAWARTEHIRVHTGERPYKCKVEGCSLSFRFVSDFSRHRRKTGHYVDQPV